MPPEVMDISPVEPVIEVAPPPAREPFWGYTDLLLVMGLIVASILLILVGGGFLMAFYPRLRDDPTPLLLPVQVAFYGFIYLALYFTLKSRYGKPVFPSLGWRRTRFNAGIAVLGGAILALAISGLAALLHTPQVPSPLDRFLKSPVNLALFSALAVTLAPVFEELFFRGFLQPLLSRTFGVLSGILITALVFGCLHAPEYSYAWQYVVAVSAAGAVFGWVRARTNSIIPSTIMHGCYNAVFVVALIVTKGVKH
jgi:membrane protease YdiL (CAAX protease family)